jgi:phosphatidate cytidylyltransferase
VLAKRVLSAVVAVPILVAIVGWAPSWLFTACVAVAAVAAQRELYQMLRGAGIEAERWAGYVLGVLVVAAFAAQGPRPVALALTAAVAGLLALGLGREVGSTRALGALAASLLGVCYCAWLLGHAVWLRALPGGRALLLLGLAVTWCGETAAYAVGRTLGRHRLAPRLSPGKTVEGAVGQVLASLAGAVVAGRLIGVALSDTLAIGLLLGVLGQVGDLAESVLKRSVGAKDAGTFLPGHGGLLDRLDSLLFNLPALYYYLHFVGGR